MNKSERQSVASAVRSIQNSILNSALDRNISTKEELHEFNNAFRSLENIVKRYNSASYKLREHLWKFLFCYLNVFFEAGGFKEAPEDIQNTALKAIKCCLILEKESSEFAKMFSHQQTLWGVIIHEANSTGNTLH